MKKRTLFGQFCGCVFGPKNELLIGTMSYTQVFCAIFPTWDAECLSKKTIRKYMTSQPLPRWAKEIYKDGKAVDSAMEAMQYYVSRQLSLACLRETQICVHHWITTLDMEAKNKEQLDINYVPARATEEQIVKYLADVLIYVVRCS